jgi:hypothetical protein
VIDADYNRKSGAKLGHKPFSDFPACPIPPGTLWGSDFAWRRKPVALVYTQTLEAGCRYFSARVVDADVTLEDHCSTNSVSLFKDSLSQTG